MDDTAQTQPVQQNTIPQPVAVPTDVTQPVQPAPQAATRPVEKPGQNQPISISGHPEQAPISMEVNEDDEEDEQPVARQEAPMMQTSHPEVILPPEVKNAGVEQGADADVQTLPEEKQELEVEEPQLQPEVEAPKEDPLPMSYQQAIQTQKQSKIKDSIKWLATLIAYHWKNEFIGKSHYDFNYFTDDCRNYWRSRSTGNWLWLCLYYLVS
jgi:hypothetical protein